MAELKPCPFCGGKAELISIKAFEWCDYHYIARCSNPNCEVDPMVKRLEMKEAIEAWNNRAENEELIFTRQFLHEHGLEFALASAWERRKKDG